MKQRYISLLLLIFFCSFGPFYVNSVFAAGDHDNVVSPLADPPVITYSALSATTCIYTGRTLTAVSITDAGGIPLTGTLRPHIYYRRNSGAWFSRPGTNTGGTSTNSTWAFTIQESDLGTLNGGDLIYYYVIAQDLEAVPNIGATPGAGLAANSVNDVITHPSSPNVYRLRYNNLNGTYTVGAGGDFSTITQAVDEYNNACSLGGPVIFSLIDDTYPSETFPITINNHFSASSINTLTIRPAATATPVITGTVGTPVVTLNGARYVTIDGRHAGAGTGRVLKISNTGAGITLLFTNDTKFNTVKYCFVNSQRVSTYSGTIVFASANPAGTGNDNNTIDNNDISDEVIQPGNAIYCVGTAGRENSENVISNNLISDYYMANSASAGVFLSSGASNWSITGNRFFQTSARLYTVADVHSAISITTGNGYTISNNIIGFADASGNGTMNLIGNSALLTGFPASYAASGTAVNFRFAAINLFLDNNNPSTIEGNTVSGIAMYTGSAVSGGFGVFSGIALSSGSANIGVNSGNSIGRSTGNNSIYVATTTAGGTVIPVYLNAAGTSVISNTNIGSITASGTTNSVSGRFTGMNISGTASYSITNNSIGNSAADNIRVGYVTTGGMLSSGGNLSLTSAASLSTFKGIVSTALSNSLIVNGNTLRGWMTSCANTTFSAIETSGTLSAPTPSITVSGNFIGTSATNWINSLSDINVFLYCINVLNSNGSIYNINDNEIEGNYLGTFRLAGLSWIRLLGASAANAASTINNNSFKNINIRIDNATVFGITANYALHATGSLVINGNHTTGTFNSTGTADYRFIQCIMTSSAGSAVSITNNDFSNVTTTTGFQSRFLNIYTSFANNPADLVVTNNSFSNWTVSDGIIVGIDITNMAGTALCSDNSISNITTQGDLEGISTGGSQQGGTFTFTNNVITNINSIGAGGYIYGISGYLPTNFSTTQYLIERNTLTVFSSASPIAVLCGVFLIDGHSSTTVTASRNKIGNFSASGADAFVYGINSNNASGSMSFTNNIIGDLRAPQSSVEEPSIAGIRSFQNFGSTGIYYNTIHLQATGTTDSFSTAAVYLGTSTTHTLRNNILSNYSIHGSLGRTVTLWRSNSNLSTYGDGSDRNLFDVGTLATNRFLFFDGTTGDQSLAAYKFRMAGRDSNSVNVPAVFISPIVSNNKFLHLDPTSNCGLNAMGKNDGILIPVDFEGDVRSVLSPFVTDIGADEISDKHLWTGSASTAWNNAANWSQAIVPNALSHHVIIQNTANQPLISSGETFLVGSLNIQPGGLVKNLGTIKVSSNINGAAGSVSNFNSTLVEGSIDLDNSCDVSMPLRGSVFVGNAVKDFTLQSTASISANIGEMLNVYGTVSFGSGTGKTLFTGNNLVLKSNRTSTARVGDLTGNSVSGEVSVERFINTGLPIDGGHAKGWQFLATPTKGQTIFEAWQEGGTTPLGFGTIITGTGSGFDITTASPSLKTYDATIGTMGNWVNATSTNGMLNDKRGRMIFVRGDRSVTTFNASATPTVLRSKGSLFQPNDPAPGSSVPAGRFTSIGNPYASAIDLIYMRDNNLMSNINHDVIVWDPLLYGSWGYGGYQTLSSANDYEPTAGGTAYYPAGVPSPFIQSGQAFFVYGSTATGSVTFTENSKTGNDRLVNRNPSSSGKNYFRAKLYSSNGLIADGNSVVFHNSYTTTVNADDGVKMQQSGENFAVVRNGKLLAVEARQNIAKADTVFYSLSNLRRQSYELLFEPKQFSRGLQAILVDKYLQTQTIISLVDSSRVSFSIDSDDRSAMSDRFYVIFKRGRAERGTRTDGVVPGLSAQQPQDLKESLSIFPNPVENSKINLRYTAITSGLYQYQFTSTNGQELSQGTLRVDGTAGNTQITIPTSLPAGVYNLLIRNGSNSARVLQVVVK